MHAGQEEGLPLGIVTEDGDEFEISASAFGAPLRNRLKFLKQDYKPGGVKSL